MKKKLREPHSFKKKKPIFKKKGFWAGVLILAIAIFFIYLVFYSSIFKVKDIRISGNKDIPANSLKEVCGKEVKKDFAFFVKENIFLVSLAKIEKSITESFPKVASVEAEKSFPDSLKIKITERIPVAVFCCNSSGQEEKFFLDKEGIVFEKALENPGLFSIKKQNETERSFSLGEKAIGGEIVGEILKANQHLNKGLNVKTGECIVFPGRFDIKTSEGWNIYFSSEEDLSWQLTKLEAVLEEKISPEKRKDLEYIDVRFGNFAPYKYK